MILKKYLKNENVTDTKNEIAKNDAQFAYDIKKYEHLVNIDGCSANELINAYFELISI